MKISQESVGEENAVLGYGAHNSKISEGVDDV